MLQSHILSITSKLLAACTLARPSRDGCSWCGGALPPSRRAWCGAKCAAAFQNNHWWRKARVAAKRRDKRRCARCGHTPAKRPSAAKFPSRGAYLAAYRSWRAARATNRLEVHHRAPCRGAHDIPGCVHHLMNLETLCVSCHRARAT